jgi:hypothetical protein
MEAWQKGFDFSRLNNYPTKKNCISKIIISFNVTSLHTLPTLKQRPKKTSLLIKTL